jgi:hypothetical protein
MDDCLKDCKKMPHIQIATGQETSRLSDNHGMNACQTTNT